MSCLTKSVTIIITLYSVSWAKPEYQNLGYKTREIHLKRQGVIQGTVVQLRNYTLPLVEVFRGIPYANPPVDQFRFMPPSSTSSTWRNVKYMADFKRVCPQKFPDESTMTEERRRYFHRLKKYLEYQGEDCLYLNIYAPYQEDSGSIEQDDVSYDILNNFRDQKKYVHNISDLLHPSSLISREIYLAVKKLQMAFDS